MGHLITFPEVDATHICQAGSDCLDVQCEVNSMIEEGIIETIPVTFYNYKLTSSTYFTTDRTVIVQSMVLKYLKEMPEVVPNDLFPTLGDCITADEYLERLREQDLVWHDVAGWHLTK